jgi:deaminated glutathione amidase
MRFDVALAQYSSNCDPVAIIVEAKEANASVVVFPEMYSNGYARFDPKDAASIERWRNAAETPDGSFVTRCREAAISNLMYVVATFLEAADPKPFNSALLIDPNGDTILHYRKVHICDFDVPEVACGRGENFDVGEIRTPEGPVKVGLMICMDREYPESARLLSRAGAEIALVANSCDLAKDPILGDVRIAEMRGRAFEMAMGIAVANYPKPSCDGHSFGVDPLGAVIAMADDSPGLTIASFDLDLIRRVRVEDYFRWRV